MFIPNTCCFDTSCFKEWIQNFDGVIKNPSFSRGGELDFNVYIFIGLQIVFEKS